jgi:formylglycine-generating enzyme required for sulfatase activity
MLEPVAWGRAALTGAALLVCAGACDSVLGIEEPQDRPTDGGEAGEPPSGGGAMPSGGSGGTTPAEGGAAGMPEVLVAGDGGGEGGQPPMPECEQDAARCGGENEKTPQVCDETGHFVENGAECPVLCAAGKCVECTALEAQCTPCEEGQADCNPRQLRTCSDGVWLNGSAACEDYCADGACITPRSCNAGGSRTNNCDGASCCRSLLVPGGTFKRDYDGGEYFNNPNFPAQISSFFLDKFEVTVGRMRAFVSSYDEIKVALKDGDGKASHIEEDEGWSTSNDLPADKAALVAKLNCTDHTWADDVLTNNYLPINCVPFYVAYAFCIWDGGRLPTNAEWNFAASGGDEYRVYPWKAPADGPPISEDHAYYANVDGLPTLVGSTPSGNGRWGQADLAGNVYEWALDYHQEQLSTDLCEDCLETTASNERTLRGGSYLSDAEVLSAAYRNNAPSNESTSYIGFRCARDAK